MNHIALYLRDIYFSQKSGQLYVRRADFQKSLFFQDGGLIFAKTSVEEERLGAVLVNLGKISAEIGAAIPSFIAPGQMLGETLVRKRYISQKDLYEALLGQMTQITLSLFSVFDAEIIFQERERFLDQDFEMKMHLPLLIDRGIREMPYHPALKALLGSRSPAAGGRGSNQMLSDPEKLLLFDLDGSRPAGSLPEAAAWGEEKFWKSMYLFYCLDVADFRGGERDHPLPPPQAPVERPAPQAPPRQEYHVPPSQPQWSMPEEPPQRTIPPTQKMPPPPPPSRPSAAPAPPASPPSAAPRPGGEAPVPNPELQALLEEALILRRRIPDMDIYQILGVSRASGEEDIKKAYFKMARKFHPDRFGRSLSNEQKKQIDEMFDLVTKAYRALVTKDPKGAGPTKLAGTAQDSEQDRGKTAEIRFRQGKTLFSQARYEESLGLLEEAVRLNDTKGDYHLLLAMAESKIPALSRKSEKDFLRAIELEPWNAEGYLGLGMLYKREGLMLRAKKQFEKAVEVDADHKAARAALQELLGEKDEAKKGIKGILSKDLFGSKKKP